MGWADEVEEMLDAGASSDESWLLWWRSGVAPRHSRTLEPNTVVVTATATMHAMMHSHCDHYAGSCWYTSLPVIVCSLSTAELLVTNAP